MYTLQSSTILNNSTSLIDKSDIDEFHPSIFYGIGFIFLLFIFERIYVSLKKISSNHDNLQVEPISDTNFSSVNTNDDIELLDDENSSHRNGYLNSNYSIGDDEDINGS